jgi:pyruvate ferredoxin oxidoreductase delta subunit
VIKRVEVNYRGIFQKNLAKRIGGDIVVIASRMGQVGFSNGRYSDSPERNGIPCKYFAFVSPDLGEEELEAECGAKLDIDEANVSVVLDDTMCKGVEPWGWHGVRSVNEKVVPGGVMVVVSRRPPEDLIKWMGHLPHDYKIAILNGDASLAGLWVNKDDMTHERVLGAIAGVDPAVLSIDAVADYLQAKTGDPARVEAARQACAEVQQNSRTVAVGEGRVWPYAIPVLPKFNEFEEGAVVRAVPRHFEIGPRGQSRNEQFQRFTTRTQRPVVRFDLCTKCQLCWYDCPDECFDPTTDGLYDVNYDYCVGCGRCAQVCPVKECIVMVDELKFDDHKSPWEHYKRDQQDYIKWAEDKKGNDRVVYPFVTGTGMAMVAGEHVPEGQKTVVKKQDKLEVTL